MSRCEACEGERERSEGPIPMTRSKEGVGWEGRRVGRCQVRARPLPRDLWGYESNGPWFRIMDFPFLL